MTAGGTTAGGGAGGAPREPDDLEWLSVSLAQDLRSTPDCTVTQLRARLNGLPFVFSVQTSPTLELLLENGDPAPVGPDGGASVTLSTSCSNSTPPRFAPDASIADVAVTSRRVGVYRIRASLGPVQQTSGTLTARPNGWFAFPADGGRLMTDAGTPCVEMIGRALPWTQGTPPPRLRFLETGMDVSFSMPPPGPWGLTSSCAVGSRVNTITMRAGTDALRFGLLILDLDAGVYLGEVPPAASYALSGGLRLPELQRSGNRICTPVGTTPGNQCSDFSECSGTACSVGPMMFPICE